MIHEGVKVQIKFQTCHHSVQYISSSIYQPMSEN
jgi:hypothetical protein